MALTDKNIVITPNIGSSSDDPKIVFSGADASTGAQNITLKAYPTSSGTLSFEGSAGQLFSITNSLSGTIYSVNDVSGIPSIEVLDTGLIKLAQYSGNVLLGTGTDNGSKLQLSGNANFYSTTTMTGGWNKNLTLQATFPGLIFNSNNTKWAGILYDYSSNFIIRVGATSGDVTASGTGAISIDQSGNVTLTSPRASVFYDSDNTAYYIDPASTSKLNIVQAAGSLTAYSLFSSTSVQNANQLMDGSNIYLINKAGNGWVSFATRDTSGTEAVYNLSNVGLVRIGVASNPVAKLHVGGAGNATGGNIHMGDNTDATAKWSFLTGAHYNGATNTTGVGLIGLYSTSTENTVYIGGGIYETNPATTIRFYTYTSTVYGLGGTEQMNITNGLVSINSNLTIAGNQVLHATNYSGYSNFGGNAVYGGLFYDGNDTSYYLDPNSTSLLNSIQAYSFQTRGAYGAQAILGSTSASWGGSNYPTLYSSTADLWVMHINPHISFTRNGYNGFTGTMTGSTIRFASNPTATSFWDLGVNGGSANLGDDVYGLSRANQWNAYWDNSGNGWTRSSHRAPVFYDNDDTGYYANPNSTSNLSRITLTNGNLALTQGDGTGLRITTAYGYMNFGAQNTGWTHMYSDRSFYFNQNLYMNGNWLLYENTWQNSKYFGSDGIIYASASMRSPIFYDQDDTGYYLNPNGTSNLGGLTVACNASTGRSTYGAGTANLILLADSTYGKAVIDFRSGVNYPSDGAQIYYETAVNGVSGETSRLVIRTENDADDSVLIRGGFVIINSTTVDGGSSSPGFQTQYNGSARIYTYSDNTTEAGSFRAPVFYDSNNTGYYIDGNNTSNLNVLAVSRAYAGYDAGQSNSFSCSNWFRSNGTTGWYNADYAVGWYATQAARVDAYNGASIYTTGNVTAYSDERSKKDWAPLIDNFVEELAKVKSGSYSRTDREMRQVGVSAQSLQKILPEAVPVGEDEMRTLSVAYGNAALVSAVELAKEAVAMRKLLAEQQSIIEALRASNQTTEDRLAKLEAAINKQ